MEQYIGTHLVMDVISRDKDLLKDEGRFSQYLTEIIKLADMTCLVAPQVFSFPYDNEYKKFLEDLRKEGTSSPLIEHKLSLLDYNKTEGSGVTGFAILCESHAAIHSFPEKAEPFISICLYSCKEFDPNKIIQFSNEFWNVKRNNFVVMTRYVDKPQEIIQSSIVCNDECKMEVSL